MGVPHDAAMVANGWSDAQTYAYVIGCLFGHAAGWARHVKQDKENPQETWAWLKAQFRKRFFHKVDQTDALHSIKPSSTTVAYDPHKAFTDLMDAFDVIKEYLPLPPGLNHVPDTHYTNAQVREAYMLVRNDMISQFQRSLYLNSLPHAYRTQVINKRMDKITDMYEEVIRLSDDDRTTLKINHIAAVETTEMSIPVTDPPEDADIDAINKNVTTRPHFRPPQQHAPQRFQCQPQSQQQHQSQQQQPRPLFNSQPRFGNCHYCNKSGHHIEQCRTRIADGKPCCTKSGKPYFPEQRRQQNQSGSSASFSRPSNNVQADQQDFQFWV